MDVVWDWDQWREACMARARDGGWAVHEEEGLWWLVGGGASDRVFYLSAGIHGDEPAGPLAVAALLQSTDLWAGWRVVCFPELNPVGLRRGTRENAGGIDLNREYARDRAVEVAAHRRLLGKLGRFSAAVCLHEDWEATGAYLYYLHRGAGAESARRVLAAMGQHVPLESSGWIDGREAEQGVIHRRPEDFEGADWPEAIYLARHHTEVCYTLETPSGAALEARVAAHVAGVEAVVREMEGNR
jgi:predicted deacylase